jgi:hypothetical protein
MHELSLYNPPFHHAVPLAPTPVFQVPVLHFPRYHAPTPVFQVPVLHLPHDHVHTPVLQVPVLHLPHDHVPTPVLQVPLLQHPHDHVPTPVFHHHDYAPVVPLFAVATEVEGVEDVAQHIPVISEETQGINEMFQQHMEWDLQESDPSSHKSAIDSFCPFDEAEDPELDLLDEILKFDILDIPEFDILEIPEFDSLETPEFDLLASVHCIMQHEDVASAPNRRRRSAEEFHPSNKRVAI